MAIVSAEKFVQAARDNGYAVGGFNTNNLEWTQAILRAAEAKQAPILIQTSMGAAKYMGGYKLCKTLIENLVESMGITVPVAIHLDHGHFDDALECIEVGYTSVMFDGSHLPIEENLEKLTAAIPGFPIVLHGGSGIPDDQIKDAIKLGVAKVNVNTECQIAFAKATRKFVADYEANEAEYDKKKLFDPRKFLKPGFEAITEAVEERIDVFGSANKA